MMSTVKTYLSRIRAAHRFRGYRMVESDWTHMLYKGLAVISKSPVPRLAMTPDKMLLIKERLASSDWRGQKRRLFWMACCFAFHGSLRSSEYLPPTQESCNPNNTLLVKDVKPEQFTVDNVQVNAISMVLKEPKELKTHKSKSCLELFETSDFMCPFNAYNKYVTYMSRKGLSLLGSNPLFMLNNSGYTRNMFNSDIQFLLKNDFDYSKGKLLSHSFRSGLATAMARAGFSQEQIMLVGRWSSDSYLNYIKQGRSARFETMRQISLKMAELSRTWSPGTVIV